MFLSPDSGSCLILRSIGELTPFLFPVTPSSRCSWELYVPGEHKARSLPGPRGAGGVRTAQNQAVRLLQGTTAQPFHLLGHERP